MNLKNNKEIKKNKIDESSAIVVMAVFILLIAIFSFNFTSIGITGGATTTFPPSEWINWLIGDIAGLALNLWAAYAIYIIVFLMLAVAFSDIFSLATPFSTPVAWILGFGLAIIASLTGLIRVFAHVAFAFTAGFGTVAVVIVMCTAFVAFIIAGKVIRKAKISAKINKIREKGRLRGGKIAALGKMAEEAEK